jgi:hypothetical protein
VAHWSTTSLEGPGSNLSEPAGTVNSPRPSGKYSVPVKAAITSAAARLKVLCPEK